MNIRFARPLAAICFAFAAIAAAQTPASTTAPDRYTIIRCGTLLDIPGKPPRKDATLIIKNDRIDRIIDGFGPAEVPAGSLELDFKSRFVMPGLIDCHVHLGTEMTTPEYRLQRVQESDGDSTVRTIVNARKTLAAGFTTVRDVGGRPAAIFAVRDGINRGDLVGPRILASGKSISTTGGHGDPTNGLREDLMVNAKVDDGVADGADECMKAVRHQIKLGADLIKITATGGVLSQSTAALGQHFSDDELKAITFASHAMGRRVAAHAHGTDGINAALRAGCDSIEHGSYMNDESIRLFKEKGAWYLPTLLAGATVVENASKPGFYHEAVARKAREVGPVMVETFRKAHAAGVKIAFGTDTGVSAHGQNAREFALMVKGGMSPADCLVAATTNAAACLGIEKDVGTLEPGKAADFIALESDPTADITTLERVREVVKSGVLVTK